MAEVRVRYFAAAADAAGRADETLSVAGATVGDLRVAAARPLRRADGAGAPLGIDPGGRCRQPRSAARARVRPPTSCRGSRAADPARRAVSRAGDALEPDPLRRALGEVLTLPDRRPLLDQVDQLRAHRERLGAVRRSDGCDQRDVADRQGADPVDRPRRAIPTPPRPPRTRRRGRSARPDALRSRGRAPTRRGRGRARRPRRRRGRRRPAVVTKSSATARSSGSAVIRARWRGSSAMPAASHLIQHVREQRLEHGQSVPHAAGGARQVDDQRFRPSSRRPPG